MSNLEVPTGRVRRLALVAGTVAVISLVAAACGGGGGTAAASTSSNKATSAKTAGAGPAATGLEAAGSTGGGTGSGGPPAAFKPAASGMIATVSGTTLEVQNPETGQTTVNLSSKTIITATVSVNESNVTKGVCISATGTKGSGGSVKASNVAIFSATKGECARGFGAGGGGGFRFPRGGTSGTRTTGTRPATTFKRPANFATASGKVTSKSGSKIDVQAVTFSVTKGKVTTKTGPRR